MRCIDKSGFRNVPVTSSTEGIWEMKKISWSSVLDGDICKCQSMNDKHVKILKSCGFMLNMNSEYWMWVSVAVWILQCCAHKWTRWRRKLSGAGEGVHSSAKWPLQ